MSPTSLRRTRRRCQRLAAGEGAGRRHAPPPPPPLSLCLTGFYLRYNAIRRSAGDWHHGVPSRHTPPHNTTLSLRYVVLGFWQRPRLIFLEPSSSLLPDAPIASRMWPRHRLTLIFEAKQCKYNLDISSTFHLFCQSILLV